MNELQLILESVGIVFIIIIGLAISLMFTDLFK
jgi:hypothetical protein